VEKLMKKQEMKTLIKIAGLSKAIPTTKTMVTVGSLLTQEDKDRIQELSLGVIGVKVGDSAFFLSQLHKVPSTAVIQRDDQGLILGLSAVAGG
jgi:hypothetical protein